MRFLLYDLAGLDWVEDLEEILDGLNGTRRRTTLLKYICVVADVPAEEFQALIDHLGWSDRFGTAGTLDEVFGE